MTIDEQIKNIVSHYNISHIGAFQCKCVGGAKSHLIAELIDLIQPKTTSTDIEELRKELERILEKVILIDAIEEVTATPEVGEKFDVEKYNYANRLLNEHSTYIYDNLLKELISNLAPHLSNKSELKKEAETTMPQPIVVSIWDIKLGEILQLDSGNYILSKTVRKRMPTRGVVPQLVFKRSSDGYEQRFSALIEIKVTKIANGIYVLKSYLSSDEKNSSKLGDL